MPDIDPTPDTPVTLGDRMAWWRGDMAARMITLESQVAALAGTPASDLSTIAAQWSHGSGIRAYDLLDLIYQQNASAWGHGSGIRPYNLLDLIYTQQVEIQARLDKLQAALGAEPYNSLEVASVRGLLYALLTNAQSFGIFPGGDTGIIVTDNYAFDGKRYIIWPATTGLNRAGNNDIPLGAIIMPVTTWTGYQIYIKSDAPTAYSGNTEFPVNSWFNLSGSDAYSFYVSSQYQVSGYIRTPAIPTEPYLLWSGVTKVPAIGLDPWCPSCTVYAHFTIPNWADRIQFRINSTNCYGQIWWLNNEDNRIGITNTLCHNTTISRQVGFEKITLAAGAANERLTGNVWALAPGVPPVP